MIQFTFDPADFRQLAFELEAILDNEILLESNFSITEPEIKGLRDLVTSFNKVKLYELYLTPDRADALADILEHILLTHVEPNIKEYQDLLEHELREPDLYKGRQNEIKHAQRDLALHRTQEISLRRLISNLSIHSIDLDHYHVTTHEGGQVSLTEIDPDVIRIVSTRFRS